MHTCDLRFDVNCSILFTILLTESLERLATARRGRDRVR